MWAKEAQQAFEMKAQFLHMSNPVAQFVIKVDTMDISVGAFLSQQLGSEQKLHTCTYFFYHLILPERNYDDGDWELLAIKLGEWRQWLEGAQFQVPTVFGWIINISKGHMPEPPAGLQLIFFFA